MNSKSKRCSRSCQEMLLTYSVGMESSPSRQAVTAQQKESAWSPIQEDSLRLFIEFFQNASVFHFCRATEPGLEHAKLNICRCENLRFGLIDNLNFSFWRRDGYSFHSGVT